MDQFDNGNLKDSFEEKWSNISTLKKNQNFLNTFDIIDDNKKLKMIDKEIFEKNLKKMDISYSTIKVDKLISLERKLLIK